MAVITAILGAALTVAFRPIYAGTPSFFAIVIVPYLAIAVFAAVSARPSGTLARWITPQWGGAVFYDIGNAFDDLHEFDPVSGYGLGARWRSPIGNLSLDLAYGQADGGFHVHFSAGYAFR